MGLPVTADALKLGGLRCEAACLESTRAGNAGTTPREEVNATRLSSCDTSGAHAPFESVVLGSSQVLGAFGSSSSKERLVMEAAPAESSATSGALAAQQLVSEEVPRSSGLVYGTVPLLDACLLDFWPSLTYTGNHMPSNGKSMLCLPDSPHASRSIGWYLPGQGRCNGVVDIGDFASQGHKRRGVRKARMRLVRNSGLEGSVAILNHELLRVPRLLGRELLPGDRIDFWPRQNTNRWGQLCWEALDVQVLAQRAAWR